MSEIIKTGISILAFLLSLFSISYQLFVDSPKKKRERYLERCVLHYRDKIKEILDDIMKKYKNTSNKENIELRKLFDPLFEELRYYIHDMKFFDKKYKTNIYTKISDEILKCQAIIFTNSGDLDKHINTIKETIITAE
mgnify:CR=1 FL=1